jgi:hypothetical protein
VGLNTNKEEQNMLALSYAKNRSPFTVSMRLYQRAIQAWLYLPNLSH